MEICSYQIEGAQKGEGSHQINCMEMSKLTVTNTCIFGDTYLKEGSSVSFSSTSDFSSTISSCKNSFKSRSSSFSKPSWLLSTVADLDEKMKRVALKKKASSEPEKENDANKNENDTFAQRAEAYYHTRPQLISLLNDLYNGYVSLADRYSQTLAKHNRAPISAIHFDKIDCYDQVDEIEEAESECEAEAESSVSYQCEAKLNEFLSADLVVAELVIKMVDFEIVVDELGMVEKRGNDSSKKIELQSSLLEVLESERVILLNENSRLGCKVAVLAEKNKGLISDNMFMKRKAGELARCMLKVQDDHRVCILIRQIEDLEGQIYKLEKRNKDYYQQILQKDTLLMQFQNQAKKNGKNGNGVPTLGDRFRVDEDQEIENQKIVLRSSLKKISSRDSNPGSDGGKSRRTLSKLWDRVKNLDLLQCGPHLKD